MSQSNKNNFIKMDKMLAELPWYVEEYIDHKSRRLSSTSLLNYVHDLKIFFTWLNDELLQEHPKIIALENLEKLTIRQVESYLKFLVHQLGNKDVTVNRKLSSLKSLFNYLQNTAETEDLKPYIQRNVMAKIEFNDLKNDQETIANKMEGKILQGKEYSEFRLFIAHDYGELHKDNKKKYNFHVQNRERDTAIISLILGSGLRLSEIANLDITDIDFNKSTLRVIRKGNKEQYVYFSTQAMSDLQAYMALRETKYHVDKKNKALFISAAMGPRGTNRRLTPRAIEKLVEKYAMGFGKPALSVHKLRHSFATKYHLEVNDVPKLRKQLGHSSVQTTMIYTHLKDTDLKEAVEKMDIPEE
ncbi:tyrosine recombinase XerS [Alkalihalobacillus pseudalcaliphilus]|uniref:tyrosine recombinase XerS n=1 Tax=Alkalihalobacillus pseudalcaliphilus TaxID=79884 RepID=UPI00064DBA91|nr:tyrosine recombinase XerS [Alkalihalobacillus pseudalcaliphilus]KMK76333.1 integrase [Alkalihalobacillus pseudalcaliphilus]